MGIKRIIDVGFWNDSKVLDYFSPEDKYFMLYLLTNPRTTQLGIYELNIKKASFETGYNADTISVLLERFENKYGLVKYSKETSEVAIRNFLKHSIVKGGKPVEDLLVKELGLVKDRNLINYIFSSVKNYPNINITVEKVINDFKNDNVNDNDNDNDVSYHDSYHDSLIVAENPAPSEIEKNFEIIYQAYRKKVKDVYAGKTKAFTSYNNWLKGKKINGKTVKLTHSQIIKGFDVYYNQCIEKDIEEKFRKNIDTLMNNIIDYVFDN